MELHPFAPNPSMRFIHADYRVNEILEAVSNGWIKGVSVSTNANREPAARFTEAWHAHCRLQHCTYRDARAGTAVRLEGGGGDANSPSDYLWDMEVRS